MGTSPLARGRKPAMRGPLWAVVVGLLVIATFESLLAAPAGRPRVVSTVKVDKTEKEQVKPGEVLTYTIVTANKGNGLARDVDIINPVPPQTVCIPKSASGKGTTVLFSVDGGKSYSRWPVKVRDEETKEWKEATPEQITHVKWTLQKPLPPGKQVVVTYQVRVK